jgi:hypothetical protein
MEIQMRESVVLNAPFAPDALTSSSTASVPIVAAILFAGRLVRLLISKMTRLRLNEFLNIIPNENGFAGEMLARA